MPKILAAAAHETTVVHLAAAISLQDVAALMLNEYALARPTIKVRTVFGASNELADQIAIGRATDVSISASQSHIDRLMKAGLLDGKSRWTLATNGLAVVGEPAKVGKLRKLSDIRRLNDYQIVIADAAFPLGKCTADALKQARLYEDLRRQFLIVDNSQALVSSMRAGGARIGIVFGSDAASDTSVATPGATAAFVQQCSPRPSPCSLHQGLVERSSPFSALIT